MEQVSTTVAPPEQETQAEMPPLQEQKKVSKTKQKYLNPKTGKMVGYVRAKNLGLV